MTVKHYLQRAFIINRQILSDEAQLEVIKTDLERITPMLSDMPKGAQVGSKIEKGVAVMVDLKSKLEDELKGLYEAKAEISNVIDLVPDESAKPVLQMRYLALMPFKDIAERLNYTERQIYNLHDYALTLVEIPETFQ